MSSTYERACQGKCGKVQRTSRHWTCLECEDRESALKAQRYDSSPMGELDRVSTLEELIQWMRDHLNVDNKG